jgi:small subunit ribosomal protein S21
MWRPFEPVRNGFGAVVVDSTRRSSRQSFWPDFSGGNPAAAGSVPLSKVFEFMQIMVRDNNVDQALRALKKKLQREGVYREMKLRRHYEKPSEKRAREKAAAVRRARKMDRKRMERDG